MQGGTIIPNDSNMDNYKTPGNYYITSNSGAQSLSNAPFAHPFTLKVEYPTGIGGFVAQTFREFNTGIKAYRCSTSNASEWGDYYYFSDDATLSQISAYSASKPESTEELTIGETYNVVVRKHGRIVSIQFDISGTLSVDNRSILLFTLDEGYRPISTVLHNYITQGRNTMLLSIYNSGTVNIATFDKAPITGFILRQTITYIAADE